MNKTSELFRVVAIAALLLIAGCGSRQETGENQSDDPAPTKEASAASTANEQQSSLRNGSTVLVGLIDGMIDAKEFEWLYCFRNDTLSKSGWISEFKNRNGIASNDGRALQRAIESDPALTNEVIDLYDLAFDATHGLICNTKFEDGWELGFGQGGILDMGKVPLSEVTEAPEYSAFDDGKGYSQLLRFDVEAPPALSKYPILAEGHTYVVRTAKGKFAKFHVQKLHQPKDKSFRRVQVESMEFDWVFRSNGTRNFRIAFVACS